MIFLSIRITKTKGPRYWRKTPVPLDPLFTRIAVRGSGEYGDEPAPPTESALFGRAGWTGSSCRNVSHRRRPSGPTDRDSAGIARGHSAQDPPPARAARCDDRQAAGRA